MDMHEIRTLRDKSIVFLVTIVVVVFSIEDYISFRSTRQLTCEDFRLISFVFQVVHVIVPGVCANSVHFLGSEIQDHNNDFIRIVTVFIQVWLGKLRKDLVNP